METQKRTARCRFCHPRSRRWALLSTHSVPFGGATALRRQRCVQHNSDARALECQQPFEWFPTVLRAMDRPRLSGASQTPVRAQRSTAAPPSGGSGAGGQEGGSSAALPALLAPLAGADAVPWPHPRSLVAPVAESGPASSAAQRPKSGPVLPTRGAVPSRDSSVKRLAAQFGQSGGDKQKPAAPTAATVASPAGCCSSLSPEPSVALVFPQKHALPAAVSNLADAAVDGACSAVLKCVYWSTYALCTGVWWAAAAAVAWATAVAWTLALALGAAGLARDAWRSSSTGSKRITDAPAEMTCASDGASPPPRLTRRQSLHALLSLREGALVSPGSSKAAGRAAAAGAQAAHALRSAASAACPSPLHSGAFWAGVLLSLVSGRGGLDGGDDAM